MSPIRSNSGRIKAYWHPQGWISATKHNGEWEPLVLEVGQNTEEFALRMPIDAPHNVLEAIESALQYRLDLLRDGNSADEAALGSEWTDQEIETVKAIIEALAEP